MTATPDTLLVADSPRGDYRSPAGLCICQTVACRRAGDNGADQPTRPTESTAQALTHLENNA
jgi:hypothetical protein